MILLISILKIKIRFVMAMNCSVSASKRKLELCVPFYHEFNKKHRFLDRKIWEIAVSHSKSIFNH